MGAVTGERGLHRKSSIEMFSRFLCTPFSSHGVFMNPRIGHVVSWRKSLRVLELSVCCVDIMFPGFQRLNVAYHWVTKVVLH